MRRADAPPHVRTLGLQSLCNFGTVQVRWTIYLSDDSFDHLQLTVGQSPQMRPRLCPSCAAVLAAGVPPRVPREHRCPVWLLRQRHAGCRWVCSYSSPQLRRNRRHWARRSTRQRRSVPGQMPSCRSRCSNRAPAAAAFWRRSPASTAAAACRDNPAAAEPGAACCSDPAAT